MSARRILVTGADGFTGRYLTELLATHGWEVHGLVHRQPASPVPGLQRAWEADLTDAKAVADVVAQVSPSHVAHLAAIAFVAHGDVEAMYRTNLLGTRHLLQALTTLPQRPEAVTYWIVLGGEAIADGNTFRLRRLANAVRRTSADGLLVRVSSLDLNAERAYALQTSFLSDMVQAMSATDRELFVGRRVVGAPA